MAKTQMSPILNQEWKEARTLFQKDLQCDHDDAVFRLCIERYPFHKKPPHRGRDDVRVMQEK